MKKKIASMLSVIVMGAAILAPTSVYAWSDGEDDSTPGNTQTIVAQEEGSIAINGQIGIFENNVQPGPIDPLPPDGDVAWINVTIPTNMIFASTQADNLNIIGPKYGIVNNSARGVDVYAKEFQLGSNNISGTTLQLVTGDAAFATVENGTVMLLDGATDTPLNAEVLLAKLDAGSASGGQPGDLIDTDKGMVKIKMSGSLPNGYDYQNAVNPTYTLILKFKAH